MVVIGAGPAGQVAAELAASFGAPGADRRAEQARWGGHDHRRRTHEGAARSRALPDRLPPGGGLRHPGGSAAGCGAADHPHQGRAGGEAEFVRTNVSREDDIAALIRGIGERHGRLDVAFNNAGISGEPMPLVRCTLQNWDRVVGIKPDGRVPRAPLLARADACTGQGSDR